MNNASLLLIIWLISKLAPNTSSTIVALGFIRSLELWPCSLGSYSVKISTQ